MDMGNKQSGCPSEAEDPAEPAVTRLPPSGRRLKEAGDFTEDGDDAEVAEVPPPMRPISSLPAPDDSSLKKVSLHSCDIYFLAAQYIGLSSSDQFLSHHQPSFDTVISLCLICSEMSPLDSVSSISTVSSLASHTMSRRSLCTLFSFIQHTISPFTTNI